MATDRKGLPNNHTKVLLFRDFRKLHIVDKIVTVKFGFLLPVCISLHIDELNNICQSLLHSTYLESCSVSKLPLPLYWLSVNFHVISKLKNFTANTSVSIIDVNDKKWLSQHWPLQNTTCYKTPPAWRNLINHHSLCPVIQPSSNPISINMNLYRELPPSVVTFYVALYQNPCQVHTKHQLETGEPSSHTCGTSSRILINL